MSTELELNAEGAGGPAGHDGRCGSTGERGGDASPASPGAPGGRVELRLRSDAQRVELRGTASGGERQAHDREETVLAGELGDLVVVARGGDGGQGGDGGKGGDGHRGSNGSDATSFSSGSDGGNGGDGGDGGRGSNGAPGGDGGVIDIYLDERDLYLLMAVAGCDAPKELVRGGVGGVAGHHGAGGAGGPGGSGGSSYSWTESVSDTESYTDSDGNSQTRSVTRSEWHSNPGGSSGFSGAPGRTPTTPLHDGHDGATGRLAINVSDATGATTAYRRRYDLELVDFVVREDDTRDADGIVEFGEVICVGDLRLRNVGGMPTPPRQRVRLTTRAGRWAEPLGDELFLAESVAPGADALIAGRLRLQVNAARIESPGEPFVAVEKIGVTVEQLGDEATAGHPLFSRPYARTALTRTVTAHFPLENRGGLAVLRSLAPGEQTRFSFDVANISRLPLGEASSRRRRVGVQLALVGGDLSTAELRCQDAGGREVDLGGEVEGFAGHFVRLPEIAAGATTHVTGAVGFRDGVAAYAGAELEVTIWIEHLHDPAQWTIVQRRRVTLRVEPAYRHRPESRVLLVVNHNTTREAFLGWRRLLDETLGLGADVWSLSREGHLDLGRALAGGGQLRAHLQDRVALLLNLRCQPRATADTDLPTDYLRGRDFRLGATVGGTRFVILGAPDFSLRQLLEPTADTPRDSDLWPDADRFLRNEAETGGPRQEQSFRDDLTTHADLVVLQAITWFRPPKARRLREQARRLARRLAARHPERRYVLVLHPEPPARLGRRRLFPRWSLGKVEVRRTLNIESSAAVTLAVGDELLNDPAFIASGEARFAVLLALPFAHKLERLSRLLVEPLDAERGLTLTMLVRAILVDFSEEQAALHRSHVPLEPEALKEKLANLERLLAHRLPGVEAGAPQWAHLVELAAGLVALTRVYRRWWRWFGRTRRLANFLERRVRVLVTELCHAEVLDDPKRTGGTAALVESRATELAAAFRERRAVERYRGERSSLEDTARRHVELGGVEHRMTRDIDVWLAEDDRLWTVEDFARAQEDERRREAKQDELRQLNERDRRALLLAEPSVVAAAAPVPARAGVRAVSASG